MSRPNLFYFATRELSQDAFICWLLSWAAPEFKVEDLYLHECALSFVNVLFQKHGKVPPPPEPIRKIEVKKQDTYIDVLCIINDKYMLLIEDKVGTKNHSGQLKRYHEEIKGRVDDVENVVLIYRFCRIQ